MGDCATLVSRKGCHAAVTHELWIPSWTCHRALRLITPAPQHLGWCARPEENKICRLSIRDRKMSVVVHLAKHTSASWMQELLPCMSVVLDRVSARPASGHPDLYVVQASDDVEQWREICAALWTLYRESDHDQECTVLKGETEGQLFFCTSPSMREVHSSHAHRQYREPSTCPSEKPLSLLLVLRPLNLWSGVVDEKGRRTFGATWSCEAFEALANDVQEDVRPV